MSIEGLSSIDPASIEPEVLPGKERADELTEVELAALNASRGVIPKQPKIQLTQAERATIGAIKTLHNSLGVGPQPPATPIIVERRPNSEVWTCGDDPNEYAYGHDVFYS